MSAAPGGGKIKLSDILAKKRKEDPNGLRNAQRTSTMAEYLRDDLIAAGINPDSVEFGGNPDLAVGASSIVSKNLRGGLSVLAKHQAANGNLSNKPLEKFLDADVVAAAPAAKCPKCNKNVFKAEEVLFREEPWHKDCFTCGALKRDGCGRILRKGEYDTHANHAYCNACFTHLFQLGAARGAVLTTEAPRGQLNDTSSVVVEEAVPEKKLSIAERVAQMNKKVESATEKK